MCGKSLALRRGSAGLSENEFIFSCIELGSQEQGCEWVAVAVSSLPPILFIVPFPNPSVQSFTGHPLLFHSPSPHPPTCLISSYPRTPFFLLQELLRKVTGR